MESLGDDELSKPEPKDFTIFKSEFTKWQKKFGLTGYKVYFKHECLTSFAQIIVQQKEMVATVSWTNDFGSAYDKSQSDPRKSAKHEALHLLVYRLEDLAYKRFIDEDSIYETTEELVRRLEEITA